MRFRTFDGKGSAHKIVGYLERSGRVVDFGYLINGETVFWRSARAMNSPERLRRMASAVQKVISDPPAAAIRFGGLTGRCSFCGKSISAAYRWHAGHVPELLAMRGARKQLLRERDQDRIKATAPQGG